MSKKRIFTRPVVGRSQRFRAIGLVACLGFILSVVLWLTPAAAQEVNRASVVIDGVELFRLGTTTDVTAEERAAIANRQIQAAVESGDDPEVEVAIEDQQPKLFLDGNQILTITQQDLTEGRSPLQQANFWASRIENQIEEAQRQRTNAYLQIAIVQAIVIGIVALLIHIALGRFWRRTLGPELRAVTHIPDPDTSQINQHQSLDLFLGLLLLLARIGVWLGAALYVTNLFPWTRGWSYRLTGILIDSFVAPLFKLGENQYSVINLLTLAALLFALEIITKTITNLVKTRVLRVTITNRGTREVIAVILRYSLLFIGALVLLQIWGIDLSSLALLASALGIGIGLGLQDIAKDIGSGLVLLFERPIQVGDFVQVGEFEGTIEQIGARSTLIRTLDHISIIVPNSRFLSGEVINWSHRNPVSRLHVPVGIAYGSDMNTARSALLEAAQEHARVLTNPKPVVFFRGFGDSSLDLDLLVWTAEPSKHVLIKSELYFDIEAKFRKYNVEIPFPQRDLHVRSGNLPIELSPQIQQTLQQLLQMNQNSNGKKDN
ncbi:MAG: hypothetical protein Kow00121_63940 [Elainellaceae cyanobacterium]